METRPTKLKKPPARLWAYELKGSTRAAVAKVGDIIIPHLEQVLGDFYEEVMRTPDWAAFFERPGLREHAKSRQLAHWKIMFAGDFSQEYFASAERIGRIHYKIGLPLSHYVAAYSRVALRLQMIVLNASSRRFFGVDREQVFAHLDALTRVLMLDTEIAVSSFHEAQTEDFAGRMERLGQSFESEVGRVVEVLNASMIELDRAAGGMSEEISLARQGAGSVSANAAQIATSAQSVASAIEQLSASITSITQDVSEAARASMTAATETEASSTQVEALQTAVEEIGEFVTMISEIAKQTNLLAVNATVEASRAGDAGKGFAVVAFEVKALAERISQATGSISKKIERIQSESGLMATRMGEIAASVGRMQTFSESIRVAVDEQKQAAQHIAHHAESTASNTNDMADRIHDVSSRVERSGDTSRTLKDAVTTVSGEAVSLSERVRGFLESLRAA